MKGYLSSCHLLVISLIYLCVHTLKCHIFFISNTAIICFSFTDANEFLKEYICTNMYAYVNNGLCTSKA